MLAWTRLVEVEVVTGRFKVTLKADLVIGCMKCVLGEGRRLTNG